MCSRVFKLVAILAIIPTLVIAQQKSGKRGIAYGYHTQSDLNVLKTGVTWWYNWFHQPENAVINSYLESGFEFVPMAWNGSYDKGGMRQFLQTHPDVKYLLGWNEPNFVSQANMTPSEAAAKWPELEAIADEFNLKIVSPALNYCGDCVSENETTYSDPVKYLDDFFEACADCRVDYVAIHCYMGNVSALQWYVGLFKKYGKPIWLTEFANWENNPTPEQQKSYLIGAVDYLENDPDVFRYAWFTGRYSGAPYIGLLGNNNSNLTDLGEVYVNMPVHDPENYIALPARIEAENYNRMGGILLEATSDESGFANVGYIDPNDWIEYGVEVNDDEEFTFSLRVASTSTPSLKIIVDDEEIKTINLPNTGGWQNWKTVNEKLTLTRGQHRLRIKAASSGFNINWIELRSALTTGVDFHFTEEIIAYPNPVTDRLQLQSDFRIKRRIELIDVFGRSFSVDFEDGELDMSRFPPGSYLLKIHINSGSEMVRRVIKK